MHDLLLASVSELLTRILYTECSGEESSNVVVIKCPTHNHTQRAYDVALRVAEHLNHLKVNNTPQFIAAASSLHGGDGDGTTIDVSLLPPKEGGVSFRQYPIADVGQHVDANAQCVVLVSMELLPPEEEEDGGDIPTCEGNEPTPLSFSLSQRLRDTVGEKLIAISVHMGVAEEEDTAWIGSSEGESLSYDYQLSRGRISMHCGSRRGFPAWLKLLFNSVVEWIGPDDDALLREILPHGVKTNDAEGAEVCAAAAEPAPPSASVDYLIAVLRLAKGSPHMFSLLRPYFEKKLLYLRHATQERRDDLTTELELVARRCSGSTSITQAAAAGSAVARLGIVRDIARLCERMNEYRAAIVVLRRAEPSFGDDARLMEALLLMARCHEGCAALSDEASDERREYQLAMECYTRCLEVGRGDNAAAAIALKRLPRLLASVPDDEVESNSKPDAARKFTLWDRLALAAYKKAQDDAGHCQLEESVKLSESIVWRIQRRFYDELGTDAWGNGDEKRADVVPFYITSNPFIADAYARVVFAFLRDCARGSLVAPEAAAAEPVFIIELGVGHGKFSLLFLRRLAALQDAANAAGSRVVNWVYVMTDFTAKNVDSWQQNAIFAPFVEQGLLDFAVLDAERDCALQLRVSGRTLSGERPSPHPVLVVANYVFDSLVCDAFRVTGRGRICQGLVTTYSKHPQEDDPTHPAVLHRLERLWQYQDIQPRGYYTATAREEEGFGNAAADRLIERVLADCSSDMPAGSSFTVPVGGLRAVKNLQRLSRDGRLFLIASDKGHNRREAFHREADPIVAVHGSLSLMVNFDAVARFFDHMSREEGLGGGGRYLTMHTPQACAALDVSMFCSGIDKDQLPATQLAFYFSLSRFGIADLFVLRDHVEDANTSSKLTAASMVSAEDAGEDGEQKRNDFAASLSLQCIVSLWRLSRWDPDLLWQFSSRALELLPSAPPPVVSFLRRNLARLMDSHIPYFDQNEDLSGRIRRLNDALSQQHAIK